MPLLVKRNARDLDRIQDVLMDVLET